MVFRRFFNGFVLSGFILGSLFFHPMSFVKADDVISTPAQVNKEFVPNAIGAGGVSTLRIVIYNPNFFPLTLSTTPASLTDTLPAGVTFASPLNSTSTCGGTVSTMGTTVSLIGGTVPAQVGLTYGSCTITVDVTSLVAATHLNTIPIGNLKATDPTGTIQVTNTGSATNNLLVNTVVAPALSKSFSNNTPYVGQTVTLSISIKNNDPVYSLTQVSLTDTLPTNVKIANATVTKTNCGSPTVTGSSGNPLAVNDVSATISGATILPGATCEIRVNVTSTIAAAYVNTILANAIQTRQGVTNASAASAPINFQSIGATKTFSPANFKIGIGGKSTFTITLRNPTSTPYTGVHFTDPLPAGLSVNTAPASIQCSGTVTYDATHIYLVGGIIPAGTILVPGSCTITAEVTASYTGAFTNSIPARGVHTDQGATNISAISGNVTVYAEGLGITTRSKSFSPPTIRVGDTSTLTIRFTAPADTALTLFSISDALPIGVQVAAVPDAKKSTYCQNGTFNPAAGDTLLTYSGGTIPATRECVLSVVVTSNTKGVFTNTISPANISNFEGRNTASSFSANLTVSGITVTKAFYPDTVNVNGVSTLTITLTNENLTYLEDVEFTDTLPVGTDIAPTPNVRTTCGPPGTVTTNASRQIIMDNGVVPAKVGSVNGICTVDVDVVGVTAGDKTNTIALNAVSGTLHDSSIRITNPVKADSILHVQILRVNVLKNFSPLQVTGGSSSTLSITLSNPNTAPLTGISFTDSMPFDSGISRGMYIANPAHASTGTCGGTLSAVPGTSTFTFSGGYLAPSPASCVLSLDITMNVTPSLDNTIPAYTVPGTGVTSSNGATNLGEGRATLINLPGASLTKKFLVNPIFSGIGNLSRYVITIQNQSNFDLTGVGLVDELPPGMTQTGVLNTTQCGGTVSYDSVANEIRLTGGTLLDRGFCTVEVVVTAPVVGSYENCIEAGVLVNSQGASNERACDILVVEQGLTPPAISKAFSPNPVATNTTSALTFTITNSNAVALTGIAFTDTFPAGLVVASPPNASQCGGTVTAPVGTDTVSLSGGTINANGFCTVVVGTKSAAGGVYPNVSGTVSSTNGSTGNTASSSLTVVAPPNISKAFDAATILNGGTSKLTFTITNPAANTVSLTGVGFTDILPSGIKVAGSPNIAQSAECGSAVFNPLAGATVLTFSGGVIPISPGNVCTVSVDITASNAGSYSNSSSDVTSTNGGTGNKATAVLTVQGVGLALLKSTTSPNFKAVGDSINYSYKLTNTGTANLIGPFMVDDNKIGTPFECAGVSPLLPGGEITCTAAYSVALPDMTAKSVTNVASASAKDELNNPVKSSNSSVTINLVRLNLDKTTDSTGYTTLGDRIRYTYTLTNTGMVNLYSPFQVSDNRINGGIVFDCGSATILPPGGVTSCALSNANRYTIIAADLTNGFVTNTAVAGAMDASIGGALVTSNTDSVTVYRLLPPVISKSFSPSPIPVGGTSELTFTITNPNVLASLSGVAFSDTFPAGMTKVADPAASQCGGTVTSAAPPASNVITLASGSLIPGGTCTVSITVTTATPGNHLNTSGLVSATTAGNGNTATSTLTVVSPPVISKSFSPDTILESGTSRMQFSISNPASNTIAITGVAFTDSFPAGLRVQNPPNATATNCGSPVFVPVADDTGLNLGGATIALGGTCVVTVDVTAPFGVYNNSTNPVTSSEGGTGVKSNTAVLTVNQAVDLSVTKTDNRLAVDKNEATSYAIEVRNAGPSAAINAHVYDTIPSSLTGVTWTCSPDPGATCTASGTGNISDTVSIPASSKLTYTITASVAGSASTNILNTASIVQPIGMVELDDLNNSYSDTDGLNILTIDKSSAQSSYDVLGSTIDYTYKLTNSGTSTLVSPFSVTDDKTTVDCSAAPASLAPGLNFNCTSHYTITQADLDDGSLTNHAYATGIDQDGDTVTSNTDTLIIASDQNQLLTLVKTAVSGDPYIHAGDNVEYNYVLANTGNVTLIGDGPVGEFTVTDDKNTVVCPTAITKLLPTETVTCTATYVITSGDITAQTVTNKATGHAKFGIVAVNSNLDTVVINIKRGLITGVVYFDQDVSKTKEPAENVLSGVTVDIFNATGTTLLTTLVTDINGSFTYSNLLPGQFVVVEHEPLGYVSTTPNTLTVIVEPDGTARADFGEYKGGSTANNQIRGKVFNDANQNGVIDIGELFLSPVTIELRDASGGLVSSTPTLIDGTYTFINLPPGVYTVVETNPVGYVSTTLDHVSVTLTSGTDAIVDFGDLTGVAVAIDPAIAKYGSPAAATFGETVVFTITVGNNGKADALNVVITDTLPDFLDLVNISVSPDRHFPVTVTGQVFTINFGTITPTDSFTITVVTTMNALSLPPGGENLAVLATSSMPEPVFNDRSVARTIIYSASDLYTPVTGFAPDQVTLLPDMPANLYRSFAGLALEIPSLNMKADIVGLKLNDNKWDVSWLGDQLAYLEETAFPTWNGNSLITGHVYKSDGTPGPFEKLNQLRYGDKVYIHVAGLNYQFEVREVLTIQPEDLKTAIKHEDKPWLTLMTCQGYDVENHRYLSRLLVRAVLLRVE